MPSRLAIRSASPDDPEAAALVQGDGARFSGKIEVWIVQMPAASASEIRRLEQRAADAVPARIAAT